MNIETTKGRTVTLGQATIDELKSLAARNSGVLLPEKVIESARNKNSILHRCFEWDNNEAAHKYRMIQARYMISVAVEVIPHSKVQTKVFVSLSKDRYDGGGYRTTVDVMSDQQMYQQLLDDALENMERFREKYQRLKELRRVVAEMNQASRKIKPRLEEGKQHARV